MQDKYIALMLCATMLTVAAVGIADAIFAGKELTNKLAEQARIIEALHIEAAAQDRLIQALTTSKAQGWRLDGNTEL